MATITMPSGGDDLYLYMHEIVEEEFPKALRQACKPLWDKKHALGYRRWDDSNPAVSKSLEELDFCELCDFVIHLTRFLGLANVTEQNVMLRQSRNHKLRWSLLSRNRKLSNVDEGSVTSAIAELRNLKKQYITINGSTSPPLLRHQLAHAREAFMALGVTLNDSRNAMDFSAAGLQDLIPGKNMYYFALSLNCYSACLYINS